MPVIEIRLVVVHSYAWEPTIDGISPNLCNATGPAVLGTENAFGLSTKRRSWQGMVAFSPDSAALAPKPAAPALPTVRAPAPPPTEAVLTPREIELLRFTAKGLTFDSVGELMGISPHTVVAHVKNIYRKLSVHSRGEAVYEASQMGLL